MSSRIDVPCFVKVYETPTTGADSPERSPTSGGHSDPVKIAGQLLRDISLPPGRKAYCHNQGGTVGHTY